MPLTKTKEFRQILKFDDFWDFTWLRINFQQHYKLQEITKCLILFYTRTKAAAAAAKSLQSCPTLCDPIDGSPLPSLGFSRQEHWNGLPFPSPMHESEREVAQSRLTLRDPMDCSPPGSSVHGIFQARVLEWGAIAFSELKQSHTQILLQLEKNLVTISMISNSSLLTSCTFDTMLYSYVFSHNTVVL